MLDPLILKRRLNCYVGDNAGSGFLSILATWKEEGWTKPELIEDTSLNQVTLYLKMISENGEKSAEKSAAESAESAEKSAETQATLLSEKQKQILACMELEVLYKTEEIAEKIGLKGPRMSQRLLQYNQHACRSGTGCQRDNRRVIHVPECGVGCRGGYY